LKINLSTTISIKTPRRKLSIDKVIDRIFKNNHLTLSPAPSYLSVPSDQEYRELAGKLSDPGKIPEYCREFLKKKENPGISLNYINFEKKNIFAVFAFFSKKTKPFFLFLFNFQQLTKYVS